MERVGSPLYYADKIIFGSADGIVYAYSTERACSIESPKDGEFIGRKEVYIHGRSVSEAGSQNVYVNINGMGWEEAGIDESGGWFFIVDPNQEFSEGLNTISCKVVDSAGEEIGASFTTVNIIRDSSLPLDDFIVTISPTTVIEGSSFTIYVNSREDGSPVDRFSLTVDGESYTGNKNITLTIPQAGSYTLTVSKIGFNDAVLALNVSYAGINPLFIGVGAILLLVVLWIIYSRFIRKRPAE